jgi:nicotinamidase-related amidase
LKEALAWKEAIKVMKLTRSIWKWDLDLVSILKDRWIEEVHLTWYESNDCVMASALESIDLWFFTFVIEEAVETRTTAKNHTMAIDILNYLKLTNNSEYVGKNG